MNIKVLHITIFDVFTIHYDYLLFYTADMTIERIGNIIFFDLYTTRRITFTLLTWNPPFSRSSGKIANSKNT